jgi:pimeloyl-ACP methyl ester carboxylesterase
MHFVLVHGSYHGPWCWDLLRPELERHGHRVTCPELPISDPTAGGAEYAQAVIDAVDWSDEPVVVGHSMAGVVIPLIPTQRPVRRLVYLCSFLPLPGMSVNEQRQAEPIDPAIAPSTAEWTDLGEGVWMVGPNTASEMFYPDLPPELAAWAIGQLRPQCYRVFDEKTPLAALPTVASSYIVARDDRALNPDWARTAARERLDIEAFEIDGGHSVFMTRPAELAVLLNSIVE